MIFFFAVLLLHRFRPCDLLFQVSFQEMVQTFEIGDFGKISICPELLNV